MVSALIAGVAMLPRADAPSKWYGPATATFEVQWPGNPYDPAENDVKVRFVPAKGPAIERIAYFDGARGAWRAVLVAPAPGEYRPILVRNGADSDAEPVEGNVEVKDALPKGFVRPSKLERNRLRWDSGEVYYPLGINLGWQNGGMLDMTKQLDKMGAANMNWTRLWACHWDGKNPWWPTDKDGTPGQLWTPALERWQELFAACERNKIGAQFVLFHHGAFSSAVNPNWPDHPWNAKNGGFLKNAADFFTDPEAKRRSKMWLRYAVARYGASPSVLAWELFNEVEWVDARYQNRWADIAAWHTEMAGYLRSIDPYGHPVVTSSAMDQTELWKAMDWYQPHTYPSDITGAVMSIHDPGDKPLFFGEFGPGGNQPGRQVVRDGIYAGMIANQAGPAQYWYWDVTERENLYSEFATAAKVIAASNIANRPNARPVKLSVTSTSLGDLVFAAGRGWEPSGKTEFDLATGEPVDVSTLAAYLQGTNHPEMKSSRIVFRINARSAGRLSFGFNESSKGGSHPRVTLGDKVLYDKEFTAAEKETPLKEEIEVAFPAGRSTLVIENVGPDWVRFGQFRVPGFGPAAKVIASADTETFLMRLTAGNDTTPTINIGGLNVPDGDYSFTVIRLDNGEETTRKATVRSFAIRDFTMPASDVVAILRR